MRKEIISEAISHIGYMEEANNENKFSRELYNKAQEWCNDFVVYCARKVGINEDLIPSFSYVPSTAEWFDARKQYKNSIAFSGNYIPLIGDLVVFDNNHNTTSDHIGLVEKTEKNILYTIEGNRDNAVKRCTYDLSSRDIRAYLVPNYIEESAPVNDELNTNKVKELQRILYTVQDGIYGPITQELVNKRRIMKGAVNSNLVRFTQQRLKENGYNIVIDGNFGSQTYNTVIEFQGQNNQVEDGWVGARTMKELLK